MLDITTPKNYADRANALLSLQAINRCPNRRLELESMAPHLASMLTEAVAELSRLYGVLKVRDDASKTYTELDRQVLDVISRFEQSHMRDICRIVKDVPSRKVEESAAHLKAQGDVVYGRRGTKKGWSAT